MFSIFCCGYFQKETAWLSDNEMLEEDYGYKVISANQPSYAKFSLKTI